MYDIDGAIRTLETVEYAIAEPFRDELERIGDALKEAHRKRDYVAYTGLLNQRKDLQDALERQTNTFVEQLAALYRAKEICLWHES